MLKAERRHGLLLLRCYLLRAAGLLVFIPRIIKPYNVICSEMEGSFIAHRASIPSLTTEYMSQIVSDSAQDGKGLGVIHSVSVFPSWTTELDFASLITRIRWSLLTNKISAT